ncbi:unnamed protein product [Menidia menidia]|uniref:(Atlantic silverside) hypothetical protein n=1 Tax=Menidia menidia TaxID=238744 RepID=A0A8S4BC53_9TELE|nr:unnamed protein product [Menidia menidia]
MIVEWNFGVGFVRRRSAEEEQVIEGGRKEEEYGLLFYLDLSCRTVAQADIVFLVDQSWSVGETSFSRVKGFISTIISSFQNSVLGVEGVRFGITVFGDVPRMRVALTDYSSFKELYGAIRDLPYEGGSRRTGSVLQFLVDSMFSPVISRDFTPKIAVLITNGPSDDQVEPAARIVADNGITLFAVVEEQIVGPRDLQVSELAHSSLRLTWSQATGDVTGYRLLVTPLSSKGHLLSLQQRQMDLKADVSTAMVTELTPKTDYSLTLYAIYPSLIGDSPTITVKTTPLPKVSNFRVTEAGLFSLRLGWTPPLGKLNGFKIFIPRSNRPGLTYEQLLPGDTFSHVIDSLEEDKKYTISIYAVYPQGPSEPVSLVGKTLKLVPVQQFLVQNATTDTVQARWTPVKGASGYRLTWASQDGHVENINLGDNFNFYMIQGLHPGSEYTVTINPIFGDTEGPITTTKAKTLESSAVQTLKVSAVSTSTAIISWNSVPGATGYRLAWGPTPEFVGRDRPRQLALNGSTTEFQLKNVAHDTEYVLTLYVLFGSVVGPGISATFRTSPLGYVSNFKVTSYTSSSIDVEWSPIVGATEYKLSWKKDDTSPQSQYLDRSILSHQIIDLIPQSTYTITICAVYGNSEGPEISLSQLTAAMSDSEPIQAVKEVKVVDIGVNSFTLSWKNTPRVSGYKISWIPFLGGDEKSQVVSAASTTFIIENLRESSAYKIQVFPIMGNREGSSVLLTARTLDLPKVEGFASLNTTDSSTILNWTRVVGVSGYLVSWRHISVLETKTETLGPGFSSYKISDLLYGRTYIFTIRPLYGEVEGPISTIYQRILGQGDLSKASTSLPATVAPQSVRLTTASQTASIINTVITQSTTRATEHPTVMPPSKSITTKKPPGRPSVTEAREAAVTSLRQSTVSTKQTAETPPVCGKTKADIVFLVDESSSIGVNNFMKMKDFIFRVVTYFPIIGSQGTQIAIVHYSDEPRIEFRLSDFKDRNSLLRGIRGLRYGGGNTKTGKGISYVLQELFQESLGMRQDVAHVLVLITDGRAQDDVMPPSRIARALGVSVLTIGVSNADMEELKKIAVPTSYKNIFYSPTFEDFPSIEREFIGSICSEELLSEFKLHDEFAQLDTPTEDPEELLKPQGPCSSHCVKVHVKIMNYFKYNSNIKCCAYQQLMLMFYVHFCRVRKGKREMLSAVEVWYVDLYKALDSMILSHPPKEREEKGDRQELMVFLGCQGDQEELDPLVLLANGDLQAFQVTWVFLDLLVQRDKGEKESCSSYHLIYFHFISVYTKGEPGYVIAGTDANFVPGRKGEPGSSGPQGPPGVPGVNGAPGLPGQAGPPGPAGVSVKGDTGEPGVKGLRGKQGMKGDKGGPGIDGIAGLPGPIGIDGVPGLPGQKGMKGEEGIGIQGIQGPRGEPGEKGNVGFTGLVGPKGERGEQGIQGIVGPRGKKGLKGDKGETGNHGEIGPIGPQGPQGLTGPMGLKGNEGPRGIPGDPAKGIIGPTGKKGARGEIGPVGLTGPQGIKGEQGDKGEKGSPGFGIPGQQGPKGENGERGNVGLSGKPGPKGKDGAKGDRGSMGLPGDPGEPGLRGKDGTPGTKGQQGMKGEQGPAGETGERGIRGPLGLPGQPGDRGEKGDTGKSGMPGTDGTKGERGEPGKPGPPGTQIVADNNILTRVIKGEPGAPGQPGLRGETGLPGQRGPEGKPGVPGSSVSGSGADGVPGKPGIKGDKGQKGDPGLRGEKGDQGGLGIAGIPGLPGTPGRSGVDGKRGLPGKDGEKGAKGDDGKTGDKGDAGVNGKDGSKGEPGLPGLPGKQVLVTPEGATIDEIRQAFPIPMGPPGATGSPGMKGDKGESGLKGEKGDAGDPGKSIEMKDIEVMFETYGIRLPLLKALIDRLLQDGVEELLHVLSTSKKTKETHTSNVITEHTKSSVKYDLSGQPLTELNNLGNLDLEAQLPQSLSTNPLNKTAEGPTLWTVTTLDEEEDLNQIESKSKGKETVERNKDEVSSLKMNLTSVNSTVNYTTIGETVSEFPETVMETVLLTKEDPMKKISSPKKKNRERGKGKGNKGRHKRQRQRLVTEDNKYEEQEEEEDGQEGEEEFYNGEDYSYEYEEELSPGDPAESKKRAENTELEVQPNESFTAMGNMEGQLPTDIPGQFEFSSHALTSDRETDAEGIINESILTTIEPPSQTTDDINEGEVTLPIPPTAAEEADKYQSSGAQGYNTRSSIKNDNPNFQTNSQRESQEGGGKQGYSNTERETLIEKHDEEEREMEEGEKVDSDGYSETELDPVYEEEERSGDYEWETEEDLDREGEGEEEEELVLESQRERERLEMEREREELEKEKENELEIEREKEMEVEKTEREPERDIEREREEWERMRAEMERERGGGYNEETGQPYPYSPGYFLLKGQQGENGKPGTKGEIGEKGQKVKLQESQASVTEVQRVRQVLLDRRVSRVSQGLLVLRASRVSMGIQVFMDLQDSEVPRETLESQAERVSGGKKGRTEHQVVQDLAVPQDQMYDFTHHLVGFPGVPGVKGEKGDSIPGEPGARGLPGILGRRGDKGTPGVKGVPGHIGPKGVRGSKGEKGNRGLPGIRGDRGSVLQIQGPRGFKGSKGEAGERGPPGFDGDKGEKGEDGPPGVKGLKGDAGTKGALGRFGARGPVGQKGDPGVPGLNGVMGRNGDNGKDGAKGDTGDVGLPGQKGSQGDAGEPGLPGDKGEKGEKGFRGFPGGIGSPGQDGQQGDAGLPGSPGIPGLNGFTGRKGDKGEEGMKGIDGDPGEKGGKGSTGFPGFPGFKGSAGSPGRVGVKGPPGPPGARGDTGPKVEEVKELVTQEMVEKCGVEYKFIVKSVDPDASTPVTGNTNKPKEKAISDRNDPPENRMAEIDGDVEGESDRMTVPAVWELEEERMLTNQTDSQKGQDVEWGRRKKRMSFGKKHFVSATGRCLEPMSEGACSDYVLLWYFHGQSGECRPFVYGGCGGNQNQFSSRQECLSWCGMERKVSDHTRNVPSNS